MDIKLICYTSWGSVCLNILCENKTQAIKRGREMKRDGYAFSYEVYKGKERIARG